MKYYFWIKFQVRPKRILAKKSWKLEISIQIPQLICFIFKFPFNFPCKKPSFSVKSSSPIAYYGEKVIIISYFSQKVDIIWNNYDSNRIWSRGWWWGDPRSILYTPVVVRSPKLSSIEPRRYLDGRLPGNTGCCWLFVFFYVIKELKHFSVWYGRWQEHR